MALEYFFHYIFTLRVLRRIVVPVYFRCIATSNALHAKKKLYYDFIETFW